MANQILMISSIICGIIHIIVYSINDEINLLFITIIPIGILTSIWNHAITCQIAKSIDRVTMYCATIFEFYYIININKNYLILLIMSISFYILAKYYKSNMCHIMSHLILTLTHIILI